MIYKTSPRIEMISSLTERRVKMDPEEGGELDQHLFDKFND